MPTPIAANVIPPDQHFEGASPAMWGGAVLRTSAGVEVIERNRTVKLLPADWRERCAEQGQSITPPIASPVSGASP